VKQDGGEMQIVLDEFGGYSSIQLKPHSSSTQVTRAGSVAVYNTSEEPNVAEVDLCQLLSVPTSRNVFNLVKEETGMANWTFGDYYMFLESHGVNLTLLPDENPFVESLSIDDDISSLDQQSQEQSES